MSFPNLLKQAKKGGTAALVSLLKMYQPLLIRASMVNGAFDEDLYQELHITFLKCVQTFRIE